MKPAVKQQVVDWLQHKDYESGVGILSGIRPQMARIMSGREHRYKKKLEYELKKLVGEDHISQLSTTKHIVEAKPKTLAQAQTKQVKKKPKPAPKPKPEPAPKAQVIDQTQTEETPVPEKPATKKVKKEKPGYDLSATHDSLDEVPPEIERIVKEHSRLFTLRSKLSEERYEIPQTNSDLNMKRRRVLSASINELSERIEMLYDAHTAYLKTREMPDMSVLFPKEKTKTRQKQTPDKLKRERNTLMSGNLRDKNKLDFQSTRKLSKKNPMPAGPKRDELLKRIKERSKRIKQIDKLLNG